MAVPKFIAKIAAKKAGRKLAKAARKAVQQSSNPSGLSNVQKSDIYKAIKAGDKGLLSMVQSEEGKKVVKENFGYTHMPDGSQITKHCYNSKKK